MQARTISQQKLRVYLNIGLWTCAVIFYGIGDLVTTRLVLAAGGRELNPVFGAMVHAFGGDILGIVIAKTLILVCLLTIFLLGSLERRWAIPGTLSLVGVGLVVSNYIQYLTMHS